MGQIGGRSRWMAFACISCFALGSPRVLLGQTVGRLVGRLGSLDAPETAFGRIADVVVDAEGRIAILDSQRQSFTLFGSDLRLIGSAGRRGQGPSEFGGSLAATLTSEEQLLIVDPDNGRLSFWAMRERSPNPLRILPLTRPAMDACSVGQEILISVDGGPELVHEVDEEGDVVRSFVPRLPEDAVDAPLGIDHFLNHGSLACDQSAGVVVFIHSFFPIVRAFGLDGEAMWTSKIEEWAQQRFRAGPDGSCCIYASICFLTGPQAPITSRQAQSSILSQGAS